MLRSFVTRHIFLSFWLLAFLIGFAAITLMSVPYDINEVMGALDEAQKELNLNYFSILLSIVVAKKYPILILAIFFPAAPTAAALLMCAYRGGKKAVLNLLSRYKPWRAGVTAKEGITLYAVLLFAEIMVTFALIALAGVNHGATEVDRIIGFLRLDAPLVFFGLFLLATTTEMGAFYEELGWRGYGYPVLVGRMGSPLKAAVVLGVFWALWHFPREIPFLLEGAPIGQFLVDQADFVLGSVSLTILIVYFVNRLGGSIIPAILIHGWSNYILDATSGAGGELRHPFDTFSVVKIIIAAVVVVLAGSNLGRRQPGDGGIVDPVLEGRETDQREPSE